MTVEGQMLPIDEIFQRGLELKEINSANALHEIATAHPALN